MDEKDKKPINRGPISLLLVDDDPEFRETAAAWFRSRGHRVAAAGSAEEALGLAERSEFEVGVFDLRLPGTSGIELLRQYKDAGVEAEILLLTGEGTIETAVEALKLGAYDYVLKPCRLQDLERRCHLAQEANRLRRENRNLRTLVERATPSHQMVGESPAMKELFRLIGRVAPTAKPVLIQGESGTGKELVARALQQGSDRADRPFVTINCAALPEQLLESEMFGHEKGAFTGATAAKMGLFEAADGGTLFIDEIGELAMPLQSKLLRVLEDGSFRRVGSLKERRADVRLIAATNRDLAREVAAGRFREDLFYRINVLALHLPPLRDRPGDIPLLVQQFLDEGLQLEPAAARALEIYRWPGNVRQLKNALERAMILAERTMIALDNLPEEVVAAVKTTSSAVATAAGRTSADDLASLEREHVLAVLARSGGNKALAARNLGVNRRSLYRMLERFVFFFFVVTNVVARPPRPCFGLMAPHGSAPGRCWPCRRRRATCSVPVPPPLGKESRRVMLSPLLTEDGEHPQHISQHPAVAPETRAAPGSLPNGRPSRDRIHTAEDRFADL
jgi:DNA-binding NtrC family response regulator